MKYGIREICDVVLKAKSNQKIGNKIFYKDEPVLYFDTLKTSTLEGAATTVYAQGGRGNSRLVAWEGERTVTFTMEDALISPTGFAILSGADLLEVSENNKIKVHQSENAEIFEIDKYEQVAKIKLTRQPYGDFLKSNFIGNKVDAHYPIQNFSTITVSFELNEEELDENDQLSYQSGIEEEDRTWAGYIIGGTKIYWEKREGKYCQTFSFPLADGDTKYDIGFWGNDETIKKIKNFSVYGGLLAFSEQKYYVPSYCHVMLQSNDGFTEPYIPKHIIDNGIIELDMRRDDLNNLKVGDNVFVDYYTEVTSGAQQIEITPDRFGGNYYLEATTLFRTQDGTDMPAKFIIPNCKIQSNFNFTMGSSGDPSTFTFTMDAFPDYLRFDKSKKVLAAIQLINDNKLDGSTTRDRTKSNIKLK